ncbi:uncharacterized protein TRUGW13939_09831 [Talaromyces rugulosus]|uniref:Fe2OG dioxygenase domain-containing protein n=1 Tax=Talaromyces rugulosus TaxID=121627 RepID=A0A7H8R8E8_TALRU|nr:uncharacterized protein TRUGW13939_09831 [Talaromyces rugulosus]QKX62670.1 hypothetical protein TRUGW13939_09831 [Talaromyces rugulosus]
MIVSTQKMSVVETMPAPLLPMAPLMGDIILYETPGTFQDSMVEDIQQTSCQNPEMAHTIHEPESDGSPGFPKETPEMAQTIPNQKPKEQSQQLPKVASLSKSIVPIQEDLSCLGQVSFDPSKHIQFTAPSKIWTMEELNYTDGQGISPVGVSEPFPLFSAEAVKQMRAEILSENVWHKYKFSSNLSDCMLRGYAPKCAPFAYDAWRSPEVLSIISKIAGIDLVPVMDLEIGHINVAVHSDEEKLKALKKAQLEPGEDEAVLDWHSDSYPFVCVTMLSDCTDMVGGETALRKGNGGVVKVRGPQMGSAVIMQGRYIEHRALRAFGTNERITSVTSFRPRVAAVKDDTVLTTVRGISHLKELYQQYTEYRFEMLQDRLQDMGRKMRDRTRANREYDTAAVKQFIRQQIDFLSAMDREIIDDDKVKQGYIGNGHLISDEIKARSKKLGTYEDEVL